MQKGVNIFLVLPSYPLNLIFNKSHPGPHLAFDYENYKLIYFDPDRNPWPGSKYSAEC